VIGLVLAVGQAGGIAGALLARRLAARIGIGPAFIGAIALCGPAYAFVALATPATAVLFLTVGWTLLSFASLVSMVLGVSVRQALVPQHLQGRVVGATRTVILGAIPLGALLGGTLAATIGIRPTLLAGAFLSGPAFVPLLRSPARRLRELPGGEPDDATAVVEVGSAPA
jgi:MFS family permease